MPTGQEIAVFDGVSGELQYLTAERLAPAGDGPLVWSPLPEGYEDGLYVWDQQIRSFALSLDAVRARRWGAVRAARDAAKAGGADTPFGRVDTTQDSLILANGASSTAMAARSMGEPFSIGWTLADNTTVSLDGDQMILLGVMISRHIGACHAEGVARRTAIDAAADAEAIAAVPVEGGWPGA